MAARMSKNEPLLIAAIEGNPESESAKLEYEHFLASDRPDSIELQVLQRERAIAASLDQKDFDRLVDEYVAFRSDEYGPIWDCRGLLHTLYRVFNLWLLSVREQRRFAVEQAFSLTRGLESEIDLCSLPVIVARGRVDIVRDIQGKILDFVRRYKGPTGSEPEGEPHEITFTIAPSWIDVQSE